MAPATTPRRLLGPALCLAVLALAAAPAQALLPELPVSLRQDVATPVGGAEADVGGSGIHACADAAPSGALASLPTLPAAPALPAAPSAAADACLDAEVTSPAAGACASASVDPVGMEACASAGTEDVQANAGPVEAAFQGAVGAFADLLDALGDLF